MMTDQPSYPYNSHTPDEGSRPAFSDPPAQPRSYGALRLFANRRARTTDQIAQPIEPPNAPSTNGNGYHPATSERPRSVNQTDPLPRPQEAEPNVNRSPEPNVVAQQQRHLTGPLINAAPPEVTPIVPDRPLLSGVIGAFSTSSLLSLLNIQKQTGALRLVYGRSAGEIFVDRGEVVDATLGTQRGAMALFQMFGWSEGEFFFYNTTTDQRTIEASLPVLQVRATLWLDNLRQYSIIIPTTEYRIQIHPEPRGEVIIESHQWGVLTKIVSGPMSIDQLALELNEHDVMSVIRTAADLVRMGVAVVLPPIEAQD